MRIDIKGYSSVFWLDTDAAEGLEVNIVEDLEHPLGNIVIHFLKQ